MIIRINYLLNSSVKIFRSTRSLLRDILYIDFYEICVFFLFIFSKIILWSIPLSRSGNNISAFTRLKIFRKLWYWGGSLVRGSVIFRDANIFWISVKLTANIFIFYCFLFFRTRMENIIIEIITPFLRSSINLLEIFTPENFIIN
jgi:hypothetical protein